MNVRMCRASEMQEIVDDRKMVAEFYETTGQVGKLIGDQLSTREHCI